MKIKRVSPRPVFYWVIVVMFTVVLAGACAELPSANPVDLSQQPEGYFKKGVYYNEFYGATWEAPSGWKPVAPNLIQLFYFGWDGPMKGQEARLTVFRQGQEIPVKASIEQAIESAAKQKDWVLAETPRWIETQGRKGLEVLCTWKAFTGGRGRLLARFWMVKGALIVVHVQAPNFMWDKAKPGLVTVLQEFRFDTKPVVVSKVLTVEPTPKVTAPQKEDVVHNIKYKGETLALVSQWYTGSIHNWKKIMEYNGLASETSLQLGGTIKIPGELVVNREPMPLSEIKLPKTSPKGPSVKESPQEDKPSQKTMPPTQEPRQLLTPAGPK